MVDAGASFRCVPPRERLHEEAVKMDSRFHGNDGLGKATGGTPGNPPMAAAPLFTRVYIFINDYRDYIYNTPGLCLCGRRE